MQPRQVTPKKDNGSVRERVSVLDNSTAVAGNLTETDESALPSREITSTEGRLAHNLNVPLRRSHCLALRVLTDLNNGN